MLCHLGYEHNFQKRSNKSTTTQGVPYDFWSVMHYGENSFSNGNGSTILTKDPKFQDVIGQRLEVSPRDVLELNLLYKCSKCLKQPLFVPVTKISPFTVNIICN